MRTTHYNTTASIAFFFFCCVTSECLVVEGAKSTSSSIPSFTHRDLSSRRRQEELRKILTTTGIFSISNNDDISSSRSMALNGLCQCYKDFGNTKNNENIVFESPLQNKVVRTTIGTATVGMSTPLELDPVIQTTCGSDVVTAMEDLRDSVAKASEAAMDAIDDIIVGNNFLSSSSSSVTTRNKNNNNSNNKKKALLQDIYGKEYPTLLSIAEASNHLEHFHIYEKQQQQTSSESLLPSAMDWHTDAGLFLAFVPAYNCNSIDTDDNSFWFQNPSTGEQQQVQFDDSNSVVIMMGAGMQHWLSTSVPIRATRHAVKMQPGQTRAWYGMMHLVPDHSIIQRYPKLQTFSDMKQHMVLSSSQRKKQFGDHEAVSIGCGIEEDEHNSLVQPLLSRRRLQHAADPSACNNSTNFFCWMQCMEIPNADQVEQYVQEDFSLYCLDPAILASSGNSVTKAAEPCKNGKVHNSNCQGSWERTAPGVPKSIDFNNAAATDDDAPLKYCYGGTSMYMDGFHWVHDTTCIIYLFPGWVLSSRVKLIIASLGTILASMFLEYIIFQRRVYHSRISEGYKRLMTTTLLYGLQLSMGYLLMLVIMTYSGVLFLCTILGLMLGHSVWNAKDALWKQKQQQNKTASQKNNNNNNDEEVQQNSISTAALDSSNNGINYTEGVTSENDMEIPEGATPCCMNTFEN